RDRGAYTRSWRVARFGNACEPSGVQGCKRAREPRFGEHASPAGGRPLPLSYTPHVRQEGCKEACLPPLRGCCTLARLHPSFLILFGDVKQEGCKRTRVQGCALSRGWKSALFIICGTLAPLMKSAAAPLSHPSSAPFIAGDVIG